jgi:hypothetical protein
MCQVSEKIKFCSCATTNPINLKNYWIWHQYNKDKNVMIVGNVFLPDYKSDKNKKYNKKTILKRLSEADAFDRVADFKNKDVLEIVLNNNQSNNSITYCFQFKNGGWRNKKYSPFELESEYDEKEKGKIKNLFCKMTILTIK